MSKEDEVLLSDRQKAAEKTNGGEGGREGANEKEYMNLGMKLNPQYLQGSLQFAFAMV